MNKNDIQKERREIKVPIKEYPNHYIDGTGLICYKVGTSYRYCKKAGKSHTYIMFNGKQIVVVESEIADKYVSDWKQYRKVSKENSELTLDELHKYLHSIIDINLPIRRKILLLNEYTNKIIFNKSIIN
jgi:hypothetical protein